MDSKESIFASLWPSLKGNFKINLTHSFFCSFSIPPGTYRTSEALGVSETTSFTLHGEGAELIAENFTLNINVLSNSNFSVVGPMTLDADPFGFTQARIATDYLPSPAA